MTNRGFPYLLLCACAALLATTAVSAESAEDGWPREILTANDMLVVVYQPQIDSLDGDLLQGRAAVSVNSKEMDEPVFGAAWLESRIDTDFDSRMVSLRELTVPRVRFPDATEEQEESLAKLLTAEIPKWELDMTLDRLMTALEVSERKSMTAEGFNNAAPIILFSRDPAVLVSIDGEPRLRELENSGLQHVVNAPFLIVQDPTNKNLFYMYAGSKSWYSAPAIEGPWKVTSKVPDQLRQLEPTEEEVDPQTAAEGPSTPPRIVVATEPTELIVTEGAPEYTPIADGELLVVSNTESDVLVEVATQRTFVLLSGRWFAAKSTDGPWEFVPSDGLPESFAAIDPDSDQGYLLVWVAGTEMAEEAVLDSYVPQTAAIKRDATIDVTYDGEPSFEAVEETTLKYAVNTASQVLQYGTQYFCAEQGVWYVASDPMGPWTVATEVPEEIYKIPPENPHYNVTYVRIYETTPEVVYVGYYPGYSHSYHYHGCLVYGTGWYYPPYWGPTAYYPRYSTWGFHVRWNPWYGWSLGFSYSTGRFTFGIGVGGWHRGGLWGPGGYRGYHRGYSRGWHHGYRSGARAGYRAGQRDASRRNMYQNKGNAEKVSHASRGSGGRSPGAATSRPNNVYTDKSGNVFRQQSDGNWQQREGGEWKKSDMADNARGRGESAAADRQRPSGGDTGRSPSAGSMDRSGSSSGRSPSASGNQRSGSYGSSGSSLNRDSQARSRGTQRSNSYSRSSGASRGGSRGGGRRR